MSGVNKRFGEVQALEDVTFQVQRGVILDEPTTNLVEHEFDQLLESLQKLVGEGMTVVFITHKIKEVMAACHAATVMRKGRVQGVLEREEMETERQVLAPPSAFRRP